MTTVIRRELSYISSGENFTALRYLGSGGSKSVWRVLYGTAMCALAIYSFPQLGDPYFDEMSREEAQQEADDIVEHTTHKAHRECSSLEALSGSPHVVSLIRMGHFTNTHGVDIPYLLLPLFSEGTLEDVMARRNLSTAEKRQIMIDLLSGLAHCHSKGYFIGDLQPKNCLINRSGATQVAAIGDVGTAFRTEDDGQLKIDVFNLCNSVFLSMLEPKDGELYTCFKDLVDLFKEMPEEFPSASDMLRVDVLVAD